jgi:glutamyl-Q tRNA(Asp) synthetase
VSAASVSTVTATTATAEAATPYVGRFAPSPTGALHLGSLTTALASCLEARVHRGRWLLRIEDVDSTRALPGAADAMLHTLTALGFHWDGPVLRQSQRTERYAAAFERLRAAGRVYPCACTRRQLAESEPGAPYPGTCRHAPQGPPPYAWRFRMNDSDNGPFADQLQGHCAPAVAPGDPVVLRRDGLYAYHLAVVVDDAESGVTDVVRGADLLDSTPWQLQLQAALGWPAPRYLHLPLVVNADGSKLSKSSQAVQIGAETPGRWLHKALILLQQQPPVGLRDSQPAMLWDWAVAHWQLNRLAGIGQLTT